MRRCVQIAIAEADSARIHVYNAEAMGATEADSSVAVLTFHRAPVLCMAYSSTTNCVVSADALGVLEYWKGDDFKFPAAVAIFKIKVW